MQTASAARAGYFLTYLGVVAMLAEAASQQDDLAEAAKVAETARAA